MIVDISKLAGGGRAGSSVSAAVPQVDTAALSRLTDRAIACIERGAPAVASAEPNLASAVTFLVSDLCAREVAVRETYKRSAAMLQMMKQPTGGFSIDDDAGEAAPQTAAQKAALKKATGQRLQMYQSARVDPETGEIVGLEAASPFGTTGWSVFAAAAEAPPDLRALAAERLLSARSAHPTR